VGEANRAAMAAGTGRATRCAAWLRRALAEHLFGFGLLDAIYFVTLYAFGSYFLIDTPINFLLFAFYFYLVISERPAHRQLALFLMVGVAVVLTISGVLVWMLPRVSPPSLYLRLLHQGAARYGILIVTPYLIRHFRTSFSGHTRFYRLSSRLGWMLLKISLWAGAIPALLSIRGELTVVHVVFLALAIPFLAFHVAVPWLRRRRSSPVSPAEPVQPFSLFEVGSRVLLFRATAVGLAVVLVASIFRMPQFWATYGSGDYMIRQTSTTFHPSKARTEGGRAYHVEYLAESNGCGQEPCHPRVFEQWIDSPHRDSTNPRYRTELERIVRAAGLPAARLCAGCHDPISLFSGVIEAGAPLQHPESLRDGISCVVCHGLGATAAVPSNGSNLFRFPRSYYVGPVSLPTLVGNWREHRGELNRRELGDDRVCVGCHRFGPLPPELAGQAVLEGWSTWPVHPRTGRRSECYSDRGCIDCHMPKTGENEKPWQGGLRLHDFDVGRSVPDPAYAAR